MILVYYNLCSITEPTQKVASSTSAQEAPRISQIDSKFTRLRAADADALHVQRFPHTMVELPNPSVCIEFTLLIPV